MPQDYNLLQNSNMQISPNSTVKKEFERSASKPKDLPPFNLDKFLLQLKTFNQNEVQGFEQKNENRKKKAKLRFQYWEEKEIKKLFVLYNEYGSMWKMISEEFSDRNPNSIKNRFYTTLRNMLKMLFRSHSELQKIPREIASKDLLRFYHARDQFSIFKGLAFYFLKEMKFGVEKSNAEKLCKSHFGPIKQIYSIIFGNEKNDYSLQNNHFSEQKIEEGKAQVEVKIEQQNNAEEKIVLAKPSGQFNQNQLPMLNSYTEMPIIFTQLIPIQQIYGNYRGISYFT